MYYTCIAEVHVAIHVQLYLYDGFAFDCVSHVYVVVNKRHPILFCFGFVLFCNLKIALGLCSIN